MNRDNWFLEWFNSPYYTLLYKHRDDKEAKDFLCKLIPALSLKPGARILDAPCGTGRHSRALGGLGFKVTGVDLSPNSIQKAKELGGPKEEYLIHDMRQPFRINYFDCAINLFSSLGYTSPADDEKTIKSLHQSLSPGGMLVVDFMNELVGRLQLIPEEHNEIEGVNFNIKRKIEGEYFLKDIQVEDKGKSFHFSERVHAYKPEFLQEMLKEHSFEIIHHFGNYSLEEFNCTISPRTIFVALKKS